MSATEDSARRLEEALDKYENPFSKIVAHYAIPQVLPVKLPDIPSAAERNEYQSASVLLQRLADTLTAWRTSLPEDAQPAIIAILNGGAQIVVDRLSEESFHGIRIEGEMGGTPCMLLSHQASVQLLCYVVEKTVPPRPIGFVIDGRETTV